MKVILLIFLFTLVSCQDFKPQGQNVIFITLDGVRYQEFFNKDIFHYFWSEHAQEGIVLGDPKKKSRVSVANIMSLSLPAYRTIHTGHRTWCKLNSCGHTRRETFSEKIKRVLKLPNNKVAVIGSWDGICRGALRKKTNVAHSCALEDFPFPGHEDINEDARVDTPPWGKAKYDKYTWEHGFKFIRENQPRLVTLSMDDSDEWGHKKNWNNYVEALRSYDRKIHQLFLMLEEMGDYGKNTLVFVTTDHGRGKKNWRGHTLTPSARHIWMYLRGPQIPAWGSISHRNKITHLDIRPFIETYLGLNK